VKLFSINRDIITPTPELEEETEREGIIEQHPHRDPRQSRDLPVAFFANQVNLGRRVMLPQAFQHGLQQNHIPQPPGPNHQNPSDILKSVRHGVLSP